MKLYATIESERAKKAQGGNKFLNIDILVGSATDQIEAGRVAVRDEGECFFVDYYPPGDSSELLVNLLTITKGEKKKSA